MLLGLAVVVMTVSDEVPLLLVDAGRLPGFR
jgi:hypothetical protein